MTRPSGFATITSDGDVDVFNMDLNHSFGDRPLARSDRSLVEDWARFWMLRMQAAQLPTDSKVRSEIESEIDLRLSIVGSSLEELELLVPAGDATELSL